MPARARSALLCVLIAASLIAIHPTATDGLPNDPRIATGPWQPGRTGRATLDLNVATLDSRSNAGLSSAEFRASGTPP